MSDIKKIRQLQTLIDAYRDFSAQAFSWAEVRRDYGEFEGRGDMSNEEAMQLFMEMLPTAQMERLAQSPGNPLHLIGLAFQNPGQSAEEWERWGYRLTQAHDDLVKMLNIELAA